MAIRKEKNGTWTVDISDGNYAVNNKRKRIIRKGAKTKKEAIELENYIRTTELNRLKINSIITIEILYRLLEKDDNINNRKISYINTQYNNYTRHIKPYFINADIKKLTYDDIFNFREHLKNKDSKNNRNNKISNNTINKIMILLKKLIDIGIRKGYYSENPVKHLRKLPIEKKEMNYWTTKEFFEFRKLISDEEYNYKLAFTLLFFSGMRLGELLALTWNDVNFHTDCLSISKTVYTIKRKIYTNTPKTKAGVRIIALNPKLMTELKQWKEKQFILLSNYIDDKNNLQVIQSQPMTITKNIFEKKYKTILKRKSNIKKIRIHDFRHSHASLLVNQGEDYHMIKERLGHASITTTIDTYSHLYPNMQKNAVNQFDELF